MKIGIIEVKNVLSTANDGHPSRHTIRNAEDLKAIKIISDLEVRSK